MQGVPNFAREVDVGGREHDAFGGVFGADEPAQWVLGRSVTCPRLNQVHELDAVLGEEVPFDTDEASGEIVVNAPTTVAFASTKAAIVGVTSP